MLISRLGAVGRSVALVLQVSTVFAVPAFVGDAWAACDDPLGSQLHQRVASFKRSGDCDLLPGIMALSDRHFNYGSQHCGGWHRTKSHGQVERELRAFCRSKPRTTVAAKEPAAAQPDAASNSSGPAQPASGGNRQSGSCSDITGTGSGSAPANCPSASGVPANMQAKINQAKSYMQAAQTVKESDPSYTGWVAAAAQFRKAAEAFQIAGDTAQAQAANDQALTLENALKIADAKAGNAAPAAAVPAVSGDTSSNGSFNIPTPCQDLTGKYGCQNSGSFIAPKEARLNSGQNQTTNRPKWWIPGNVAPDIQAEILSVAASIIDTPEDDPIRIRLVRALERRLASLRVKTKPEDRACLQPVSGHSRPTLDIPLRWKPQHIKKEAIDQSHLCDSVSEGDAKEACREEKYGQAVMWAEPELAGLCRSEGGDDHDIDKVAECAKRKFLNAWATDPDKGIVAPPVPDSWTMPGSCNANAPPAQRKDSLRDRLRARLAAAAANRTANSDAGTAGDSQPPQPNSGAAVADNSPEPPNPPPETDDNEAYCNYMGRELVRGELTSGDPTAIPPECKATIAAAEKLKARRKAEGNGVFTMKADETDAEIRRLIGPQ